MSLTYSGSYHMHCMLTLASGRELVLDKLVQERTYAGLLEGLPDSRSNNQHIERVLAHAQADCVPGALPFLVTPPRRDFLRTPGDMAKSRSEWRVPEWLPQVTCVGQFYSLEHARDPSKDGSALTVVWFQEEFSLPIHEPALSSILNVDWNSYACDFVW